MNTAQVKKRVKTFRQEFKLKELSCLTLESVFEQQGFTIIYFNPVLNNPDVETVINSFGLQDMIRHSSGFQYLDQSHRLMFINENLTESERLIVLAHEEGHYYCGHSTHADIVGRSVSEEFEANEFAHYLLNKSSTEKIIETAMIHKKQLAIFFLIILVAAGAGTIVRKYKDQKLFEGEFYVTMHGEKYHRKDCVTIEGHEVRRLTQEDVKSGRYKPCSVCRPGQ